MKQDAEIVACPNGPLLVRGEFTITNSEGEVIETNRRTVALCRCGASAIKPFCDGSHKVTRFQTEPPDPREQEFRFQ